MSAIIIISAHGQGNRDDEYDQHREVWETIPESVREALTMTDNHPAEDGEPSETKWWGELTTEQWDTFRADWNIEPDECGDTMGMLLGPPYGTLPALSYDAHGTDWNIGGIYPVDYINVYFLTEDPDFDMMQPAESEDA